MENELVKNFKKECKNLYDDLVLLYEECKSAGYGEKVLYEIVKDINKVNDIVIGVNNDNLLNKHEELVKHQENVKFKYSEIIESINNNKLEEDEELEEEEELSSEVSEEDTIEEEAVPSKEKSGLFKVGAIILGLGTAIHTGLALNSLNKCKDDDSKTTETIEESENIVNRNGKNINGQATTSLTDSNKSTEETKETEETKTQETTTTQNTLVLGEYGTFFDVTDNEQVEARAKYIYDNYFMQFKDKLSETEQKEITVENIANIIRVMNGEFPLDKDGNIVMNANVVDDYGQKFIYLVGDLGSSPQLDGRYYNVPAYMFTTDGSELQDFVKRYDEDYQKMTDGFNLAADQRLEGKEVTGGTLVREGIASVGHKFWKEWVVQGMYGDTNPYNFDAKDRLFAYFGAFGKYGTYAFEYNMNAMQAVCIPVCVDPNSKTMKELNVNEIFWGYATGEWDTVIAKSIGVDAKGNPDSIAFTQDLLDELTWKYNNRNVKTLK